MRFALTGLTVFGAIYVQEIFGFGPVTAGLALLPVMMLPLLLLSTAAGRTYDRWGPRALVTAGAVLLGGGLTWAAAVLGTLRYIWLLPGLMLTGTGIALIMTPASTDVMNTAPPAWRGQAQGVTQTLRQVPAGTPQEALDCACGLYLGDTTAWLDPPPPTNQRARPLAPAAQAGTSGHRAPIRALRRPSPAWPQQMCDAARSLAA